jgi:hypothetical protein
VLTGLPIFLLAPAVWITGASFTEEPPPPPPLGSGDWFVGAAIWLIVSAWVFATPFVLTWAELRHRKAIRSSEVQNAAN